MNEDKRYDVFLSYAQEDQGWVNEFATTLEDAGIRVWSQSKIEAGHHWKKQIEEALRDSSTLVLILTPNNLDNRWTFFEVGAAVADHKKIIPILAQDLEAHEIPKLIERFQILVEPSPTKAGERVARAVEKLAA